MPYSVPKAARISPSNSPPEPEDLQRLLQNMEQRKNIKLTKKELKDLFNGLGSRWSSWRAWRAMRYADENGDGVITHNEMNQLLMYCKKHGFLQDK
ncbi:hypothetical protein QQ045_000576 [Rhodiola kirilowii]